MQLILETLRYILAFPQDLESSLQTEIDGLQESLRSLEEQQGAEQRCRQDAEQELARHKQVSFDGNTGLVVEIIE